MKITNRHVGWGLVFLIVAPPILYVFFRGNYDLLFRINEMHAGEINPGFVPPAIIIDTIILVMLITGLTEGYWQFEFEIPNPFNRRKMTDEEWEEFQEFLKERKQ